MCGFQMNIKWRYVLSDSKDSCFIAENSLISIINPISIAKTNKKKPTKLNKRSRKIHNKGEILFFIHKINKSHDIYHRSTDYITK